jgi:hypothetical protein
LLQEKSKSRKIRPPEKCENKSPASPDENVWKKWHVRIAWTLGNFHEKVPIFFSVLWADESLFLFDSFESRNFLIFLFFGKMLNS